MRVLTAALLAALVVVLSFIAYDLHRVAGFVASPAVTTTSTAETATASSSEHERRVQHYVDMLCDVKDCDHAFAEAKRRVESSRR